MYLTGTLRLHERPLWLDSSSAREHLSPARSNQQHEGCLAERPRATLPQGWGSGPAICCIPWKTLKHHFADDPGLADRPLQQRLQHQSRQSPFANPLHAPQVPAFSRALHSIPPRKAPWSCHLPQGDGQRRCPLGPPAPLSSGGCPGKGRAVARDCCQPGPGALPFLT